MRLKKYFIARRLKENVEAEEIFLDAEAVRSIEEKGKMEQPISRRNFFILYGLIVAILSVLLLRGGFLQIVKGQYYLRLAQGNSSRVYPIFAPRGMIYDRFGKPLTRNNPGFNLVVDANDFSAKEEQARLAEVAGLAGALFTPGQEREDFKQAVLEKIAGHESEQLVLARDLARESALALEARANEWPDFRVETSPQREYLAAPYFAHVLGYTGAADERDDEIGKSGLEKQYESYLHGQTGYSLVEVDSMGEAKKILATKQSAPGLGLALFLDQDLQIKIYQELEKMMANLSRSGRRVSRASAVAIDPRDGGVLALASLPSFDSNLFARGIAETDLDILGRDPNQPFLNRALSGLYPSGSIVKPLIAAAGLEEKIVRPNQTVDCQGGISVTNQYHPEIVYYYADNAAHGPISLKDAIARSCNVYFYTLGGGYGDRKGLGVEKIKKYLELFGLGNATGIDLPAEANGLIPDPQWKETAKPNEPWYLGDTYHLAIGQGDLLVTPIQMAMAIASIANNGVLYTPRLVDKVIDSNKNIVEDIPVSVARRDFIGAENLQAVREGMREAVLTGSARALLSLPVAAAGKTGTAQFGDNNLTHAWFVSFAPYEHPEIALVIMIEEGGEGHQAAVPVAKEILNWYFTR